MAITLGIRIQARLVELRKSRTSLEEELKMHAVAIQELEMLLAPEETKEVVDVLSTEAESGRIIEVPSEL